MEGKFNYSKTGSFEMGTVFRYIIVIFLLYIYFNSVYFRFLGDFVSQHIMLILVLACSNKGFIKFIKFNRRLLGLYILILLVTILITLKGGEKQPFNNAIMKIAYYIYVPSILIPYMCNNKLSLDKCIIVIGWISGVLSTLCFMSVDVANLMSGLFANNVENIDHLTEERAFGIASGITYAYGLVNAFILAYSFNIGYYKKWYSILYCVLLLFATVINTRTSFIIEIIFILVFFLMSRTRNKIRLFALIGALGTVAYFFIIPMISGSTTGDWIIEGFLQTNDIILGTNTARNNVFYTLQDMIIFPSTLSDWLFGTGEFIYYKSDIGFIIQIFYGGLFYLLLLLIAYYITIRQLDSKYMVVSAIIMLLIANYKGVYLEYNDGLKLITFIAMYQVYARKLIYKKLKKVA